MRRLAISVFAVMLLLSTASVTLAQDANLIRLGRVTDIQRIVILPLSDGAFELRVLLKEVLIPKPAQSGTSLVSVHGVFHEFGKYEEALEALRAIRNGDINGFVYSPLSKDSRSGGGQGGAKMYAKVKEFICFP